jgi:UDP-glucose 4-epimerase
MTVLVTGGAGYIGSHMVYELADAGERVVVLDNLSTGFDWAVAKSVPLIVGETGDQALVARLIREHGIDAIIHFAASIVVPDSVRDPLGYYRNNTMYSRALIECAVKGGVRHFIFSSTAAIYGNPIEIPVEEASATLPISPYGWSKLRHPTAPASAITSTSVRARPCRCAALPALRRALAWERELMKRQTRQAGADREAAHRELEP